MIIIGYPGTGKTFASEFFKEAIDFDPRDFTDIDFGAYCKFAELLSRQGYIVMVTSHKEVRDILSNSDERVFVCYPSLESKEFIINDLKKRYMANKKEYNYKAYDRVLNHFEEDIEELANSGFDKIELPIGTYLFEILKVKIRGN